MPQNDTLFTPKLTGKNYTTPDLRAKITGTARYAGDFRPEGMLVCRLLTSPLPHARVRRLDTSAALALPGVRAILTADELPSPADSSSDSGEVIKASPWGERALTMEPLYQGDPVLAVAAVDEAAAIAAMEAIEIEYEPLPFVIDPLDSLRPGGPNARTDGNAWLPSGAVGELKWTAADFETAGPGQLPMGATDHDWSFGDVEAGFAQAAIVFDETFVTPNVSHQALEPRSTLAWWENGKLFLTAGTQSTSQTVPAIAGWLHMDADDIVFISEYTGGGFGGKLTASISVVIPALLAKKTSAPVMLRITRDDEHAIGRARASLIGRMKAGFSQTGRLLALDLFVIQDNGPYEDQYDAGQSGTIASLIYQPQAMRWRGVSVLTNTPVRGPQTAPGGLQASAFMGPILAKAARRLNLDPLAVFRVNSPEGAAPFGSPGPDGARGVTTSAFLKQALDQGAEAFGWSGRRSRPSVASGPIRRGVGVATGGFFAGSTGFDGLFVITPQGRLRIHCGVGNLGTESFSDVQRVVADAMDVPWDACEILWGDTSKHLAWSCISGGSQTIHAMSRAALAASLDAKKKLKEIAAKTLGGNPEDYAVGGGRVFRADTGQGLSLAQAARRAIELGGAYDGHVCPNEVDQMTKSSVAALVGQGLVAVAKDIFPREGQTFSYVASFAEVEVNVETGMYRIVDFHVQADAGVVVHPRAFGGQLCGRSMLGIGHATMQKWFYDKHYGLPVAKRFYQTRPPTLLDLPDKFSWGAVGIPDPQTPIGARGIGEPPTGAACAAVLCALADALGDGTITRAPVMADAVLGFLHPEAQGRPVGLSANV
ncbi:molybdopterin cofactor-binding domain-containing protein [Desulfovibrio aminophilus]|uniref:xanthine dehydrogenase family protein molybdopterin-binding subunit n=1 Tax=Desulfovibrio aminophilus TaxID=81425 RepID=UPI00339303B2